MKSVETTFFLLLRLALNPNNFDSFSHKLSLSDWEKIYTICKKQTLMGVVLEGVKKLDPELAPPKNILLQWFAQVEKIKERNKMLNQTVVKVSQRFLKDNFKTVILKGQGVALAYPNPLIRTCGDIDVWLDGERKDIIKYVKKYAPSAEIIYHHADFSVIKGVDIEVHFTPSWMNNYFKNKSLQQYFNQMKEEQFANSVLLPDTNVPVCVPTPEFNRVYVLLHIYRHLFEEGIGLRQLVDYFYILKQDCSKEAKERSFAFIKKMGMERFCSAVMYILHAIFGLEKEFLINEPSETDGKFLLSEILAAGNFGKYDHRIVHQTKESHWHKYLRKLNRNLRFVSCYPDEVAWNPLFRLWHFTWRMKNGYL